MEKFTFRNSLSFRWSTIPFAGPVIERIIPTTEAQREVFAASEMGRRSIVRIQ